MLFKTLDTYCPVLFRKVPQCCIKVHMSFTVADIVFFCQFNKKNIKSSFFCNNEANIVVHFPCTFVVFCCC